MIEKPLAPTDVELVTTLHGEDRQSFVVLLRPRGDQDRLLRALDDVALGEFGEAVRETREPEEHDGREADQRALDHSVRALRAAGADAAGRLLGDDPIGELSAVVKETGADEVIVLTAPHYVEELFHRDWASRARHRTGVPVLKLFAHAE
jgi:hypothetical protein